MRSGQTVDTCSSQFLCSHTCAHAHTHTGSPEDGQWKAPDAPNKDLRITVVGGDVLQSFLFAGGAQTAPDLHQVGRCKGHSVVGDARVSLVGHPKEPWLHGGRVVLVDKGHAVLVSQLGTDELVHEELRSCHLSTTLKEVTS